MMQKSLLKFIEHAILAPSNRNSQPWKFTLFENSLTISPDFGRWLKVSDPKKSELFISLGCALENVRLSSENSGFSQKISYNPEINIAFSRSNHKPSKLDQLLFSQISKRYTTGMPFKNRPISKEKINKIQNLPSFPSHSLHIYRENNLQEKIEQLSFQADIEQYVQPKFREEVKDFLPSSDFICSILIEKLGIFAQGCLGFDSKKVYDTNYFPLLGVITADGELKEDYIQSGQILQRACLFATKYNLNIRPIGRLTEQHTYKTELNTFFPHRMKNHIHLIFQIGYASPQTYKTKRRDISECISPITNTV